MLGMNKQIMAFFKSLFDRLTPSSQLLDDTPLNDHYDKLELLRINHDWIDVTVTQNEKSYQSLILAIDVENHELLIDDLYPPELPRTLEAGDTVEVSSRSSRAKISFYTRILSHEMRDGEACYRLELPEEVGHNHSRGAYRVYVESETELDIGMELGGEPLSGVRITNLSTEGLKLNFANDIAEQLQDHNIFNDCIIRLPSGYEIDCDIELRNIYRIRTPHSHTLCGGKLTINQPQHQIKLQQYLASVQRQQRRRESRIS